MSTDVPDLGMSLLLQSCALPGMDAMESRLVVIQEVPPKSEVQFFAVRGEKRERLTTMAARELLRAHIPRKPVSELTPLEFLVEVEVLRADVDRMSPVYAAAKAWREHRRIGAWPADLTVDAALASAVDVAIAAEGK